MSKTHTVIKNNSYVVREVSEDGIDTSDFNNQSIRWVIDTLEEAYQNGYRIFELADYSDTQFFYFAKDRPETEEEKVTRRNRDNLYREEQKQREIEYARTIFAKYGEPTNQ